MYFVLLPTTDTIRVYYGQAKAWGWSWHQGVRLFFSGVQTLLHDVLVLYLCLFLCHQPHRVIASMYTMMIIIVIDHTTYRTKSEAAD